MCMTARINNLDRGTPSPMRPLLLLALLFSLGFAATANAADYAGAISAYRRAHGLPAVKSDSRLSAVALKQVGQARQ
jgi:uncharacterized protein YkwD